MGNVNCGRPQHGMAVKGIVSWLCGNLSELLRRQPRKELVYSAKANRQSATLEQSGAVVIARVKEQDYLPAVIQLCVKARGFVRDFANVRVGQRVPDNNQYRPGKVCL
jgi:hypothetical protein